MNKNKENKISIDNIVKRIEAKAGVADSKKRDAPNTPENEALRQLLLNVHNNSNIARILEQYSGMTESIYQEPTTGNFLEWRSLGDKVEFYLQEEHSPPSPYHLYGTKFYDFVLYKGLTELPLQFPELTAKKFEESIIDALESMNSRIYP